MAIGQITVDIRQDETGAWIAQVRELPSCHTYGRSIAQAKERIREAMQLFEEELGRDPEVSFAVKLPRGVKAALRAAQVARERAEREASRASDATAAAVRELTATGVSMRDAADLIGVSSARVHQIVHGR